MKRLHWPALTALALAGSLTLLVAPAQSASGRLARKSE
jgi:hypothetical protein